MYEGMSLADQQQLFQNSTLFYNGKLYKVKNVGADFSYRMMDVKTQRTSTFKVDLNKFAPPMRRLGMLNIKDSVVYIQRKPLRQYSMGLTRDNVSVSCLNTHYPEGSGETSMAAKSLDCITLADCLFNEYPSFEEALNEVKITKGACAFDKQFAVDSSLNIFYKIKQVGKAHKDAKTTDMIFFDEGYNYLSLLLDGNYGKDLQTLAPRLG